MKSYHQPSGLQQGLPLFIDPHWSADQALAVIELLDDLLDRPRAERMTDLDVEISDPPF